MSNYTKTTNFATKDSLPSGDANKIVKGAEINTEFDNIATAVATKSNTASPTFTGTVTIPTADINGGAIDGTTIGGSSASAVTATTLVANTSLNIASDGATVTGIKDEDDMSSNSATKLATQQSIKAYVDSQVTAQDLDVTTDSGTIAIDLDSETLTVTGGTGLSSSATGNAVTLNIDSTVATLTGSQTLTNKTLTAPTISGNLTTDGTIDGRDVATDGSKLDGIEANATADQTAAEIRTLVESATDSNVFTDADHTKLNGIEASATADQTASEIRALVESASDSNVFTDADHSKLDGIEASADVTDATNVTAAGALMDSECTSLASVKALNQGVATTDSPTFGGLTATGQGVFKVDSTDQIKIGDASLTHFWTLRAGTNLLFKDNGTERMRLDSSGQLGIGTTPSTRLTVGAGSASEEIKVNAGAGWADLKLHSDATNGGSIYFNDGADAGQIFYYHPDNTMRFHTDATERMRIDGSGRLGIGTSSPSAPLDVDGSGTGIDLANFGGSTQTNFSKVNFNTDTLSSQAYIIAYGSSNAESKNVAIKNTNSDGDVFFTAGNAERMRLDSSGNVGIGTTSPSRLLHVKGAVPALRLEDSDTSGLYHEIFSASNTGYQIRVDEGNVASGSFFRVDIDGSEKMRLDSSGRLLVGKTAYNADDVGVALHPTGTSWFSATSDYALGVNRNGTDGILINFLNDASACGNISCSGTSVSLNSASDQRLKENIEDADDAGNKIDAIQVRQFNWKSDGSHQDYGMIAQELQTVAPDAVYTPEDEEEMMGVDYSKLVPMLIKEIQSLRNRIAQLETN